MGGAKVIVIYPQPTDAEAFERIYKDEHLPLAAEKISGKTKVVLSKVTAAPGGDAPFYRLAEIHYPSMEALQESLASAGTQEAAAHAQSISTGGPIAMVVCEEESMTF